MDYHGSTGLTCIKIAPWKTNGATKCDFPTFDLFESRTREDEAWMRQYFTITTLS